MMNARTVGYAIAVSALLITIPRYIAVLQDIDDWSITAWGMGILLGGGAAYIFHTWARTKRKHAGRLLVAFGANLLYEPIIVTPFVLARLWGMELAQVMSLGYAVFWSLMVATAPIVLAGGVVLALAFQKEPRRKIDESETQDDATPRSITKTERVQLLHQRKPELTITQLAQEVGCSVTTASRAVKGAGT